MINQCLPSLFVFVALECEAKALVSQFKLKKDNGHPFSIYKNEETVLTVTGVGKIAVAGGVAYTLAIFSGSSSPVMVNIGIAGHKNQAIGSLLLASKVVDADSQKVFYPQLMGAKWPETSKILTASMPNTQYDQDCLNDMEASAFYEMAVKFSSSELIHCLKIVSDNEESSIDNINAKLVAEWLALHSSEIELICRRFLQLRTAIVPVELQEYGKIVNQWHFTVSGKLKLNALLRRWAVLSSVSWVNKNETDCRRGKDVLRKLEADVDCLDVEL
jgi:hypothetical protein